MKTKLTTVSWVPAICKTEHGWLTKNVQVRKCNVADVRVGKEGQLDEQGEMPQTELRTKFSASNTSSIQVNQEEKKRLDQYLSFI